MDRVELDRTTPGSPCLDQLPISLLVRLFTVLETKERAVLQCCCKALRVAGNSAAVHADIQVDLSGRKQAHSFCRWLAGRAQLANRLDIYCWAPEDEEETEAAVDEVAHCLEALGWLVPAGGFSLGWDSWGVTTSPFAQKGTFLKGEEVPALRALLQDRKTVVLITFLGDKCAADWHSLDKVGALPEGMTEAQAALVWSLARLPQGSLSNDDTQQAEHYLRTRSEDLPAKLTGLKTLIAGAHMDYVVAVHIRGLLGRDPFVTELLELDARHALFMSCVGRSWEGRRMWVEQMLPCRSAAVRRMLAQGLTPQEQSCAQQLLRSLNGAEALQRRLEEMAAAGRGDDNSGDASHSELEPPPELDECDGVVPSSAESRRAGLHLYMQFPMPQRRL